MLGRTHGPRLATLIDGLFTPPPGSRRIALGWLYGLVCHSLFSLAVAAMILAMYFGMSESFGAVPYPWAILVNALLLIQFPLTHSVLLTPAGRRLLGRLGPGDTGPILSTTSYAIIASAQLLALFALWTPSGVVWWRAPEGWPLYAHTGLYALTWLILIKATFDAGAEVQAGALGWMSLVKKVRPVFPDMPTTGLFRVIRQPIYVAFALTLWATPMWTPDQLAVALTYTAYCLLAPRLKERRFERQYGERFLTYRRKTPYALPRLGDLARAARRRREAADASLNETTDKNP
ncbi:MAG: isoprenylcysteine carboxylmethyltransferase family protein [Pseudomonadota bacterium]